MTTLVQQYMGIEADNLQGRIDFLRGLRKRAPQEEVLELCMWLICSAEGRANWALFSAASHEITAIRNHTVLERLMALREELKGDDSVQEVIRSEVDYMVAILLNAREGAPCNCRVYEDSTYNVSPYQEDLEVLGESVNDYGEGYRFRVLTVRCMICGRAYDVEIDDLYHYPHSHWRLRQG
ncbi:MAG: hypothetical protein HXY34_07715 [Candidatus Thorarchaeota archaeon]|nr:hypothetical protein [Candidatus Thorarchaeota archaeon]